MGSRMWCLLQTSMVRSDGLRNPLLRLVGLHEGLPDDLHEGLPDDLPEGLHDELLLYHELEFWPRWRQGIEPPHGVLVKRRPDQGRREEQRLRRGHKRICRVDHTCHTM